MDTYQVLIIIIPPIAAALGFLLKYYLERRTEKRLELNKRNLDRVEYKLRVFYQPILTNLIRENNIFQKLILFKDNRDIPNEMKLALDKEILDIHLETQKIIQNYLIDINPSEEILQRLVAYDQHVLIFTLLRKYKMENDASRLEFPSKFGAPYPSGLKNAIAKKIYSLKNKQNKLVGNWKQYNSEINPEPYI